MYTFSGADSARSPLSPSFQRARRKLLSFASAAAIAIALPTVPALAQEAGKYFNADGTKTDDLEKAAASWRTPEFLKDHALAGVKAEYAYAFGITGKKVVLGEVDSGILAFHPQLLGKFTSLTVTGTYGADGWRYESGDRNRIWKAGDKFSISGDYDVLINDSHGTAAAGEMVAKRDGLEMHGIAFDAHLLSSNSGGTDGSIFGPNVDYDYFKEAYGVLSRNGARVVNSSWGQEYSKAGDYGTIEGLTKLYNTFVGKKTFLDAAFEVSKEYGTIQVWANGNEGRNNPRAVVAMPYFRPEVEPYWIGVTGVTKNGASIYDRCGVTKYWCMAGPTVGIYSTSVGRNGEDYDRGGGNLTDKIEAGYTPTYNGTSAAAPNVTASLGLVMDRFPYMTGTQARDVLFTTAEHLTESRVVNDNIEAPNAVFGWGRPDLKKAMNGPGQFLGRFDANLGVGITDTWSNDISQAALDQRKTEEVLEIADWKAKKTASGWNDGQSDAERDAIVQGLKPNVPNLLKALVAVISTGKFEEELKAVRENGLASVVLDRLITKATYPTYFAYASDPQYPWIAQAYGKDLAKLLSDKTFSILDGEIAETKNLLKGAFENQETRTAWLATKTYDAGLTKSGEGLLTLAGNNTYRGDTIVDGGELAIAQGGSIISNTVVNNTGQFSVDGTAATATINRGGAIDVGVTGVTGDVTINGGSAGLDGSSGKAIINSGGRLSGTGRLVAFSANAGGTVAPGHSVGVLHVSGDATFNPGSVYEVEVAGEESDRIEAEGNVYLLGGIVSIRPEAGGKLLTPSELVALRDHPFTILTASGGVNGMFDAVAPGYVFIGANLAYDTKSVKATLARNGIAFESVGSTRNERALLRGIDSTGFGNTLHDMIVVADNREMPAGIAAGISGSLVSATLSGVLARDASVIGNAAQNRVRAAFDGMAAGQAVMAAPLAYAPARKAGRGNAFDAHPELAEGVPVSAAAASTALWGEAYGGWAHAGGDGNAAGYSRNTGGFVTGLDGMVAETWRMGVLAGYGNTSLDGRASTASVDSYSVGLYGGTAWDNLHLSLGTALSQNEIDTDRTAAFGNLVNRHSASYDAKSMQVFGELGYTLATPYADFEPFAAVNCVHLKSGGFQENGAISNLTGLGGTTDLTTTTLGLRASRAFALSDTVTLNARGLLGWSHAFGDVTPESRLAFAGGQPFDIEGLPVARDMGIVEAGFDVGLGQTMGGKATTLGLTYSGQFSDSASDHAVKADLTVMF